MVEMYLWEELATFAQTGTLAQTAQQLHITQPAVTRGMQKLEAQLGVPLFLRQPNRLTLTKTGQLAAQKAAALLELQQKSIADIVQYDQNQHTLPIASTMPGPLILLRQLPLQSVQIQDTLLSVDQIRSNLTHHAQILILSNQQITGPGLATEAIGQEKLYVHLDQFMYQANQQTVSFQDLKAISFVVLSDIGPWKKVIQAEIPDAKFLYQGQRDAFSEITKYSDFPFFSSNLTPVEATQTTPMDNRVRLALRDQNAEMTVYANYLTSESQRVLPIIQALKTAWPPATPK